MNILIVDDSKAMRMIVKRTLRQAGFGDHPIVEAENGKDAVEAIQKQSPDLVLSDWNMPEMSGIELLGWLRQSGLTIKFGFITSEGTAEMRATAKESGALFVLSKPFTTESFQETLTPHIK